jgi:hypothetical protein
MRKATIRFVMSVRLPVLNILSPELNPICYLLALLAHDFLHVSRIRFKLLTLRILMSHIYIYDISNLRIKADRRAFVRPFIDDT